MSKLFSACLFVVLILVISSALSSKLRVETSQSSGSFCGSIGENCCEGNGVRRCFKAYKCIQNKKEFPTSNALEHTVCVLK